MNSKENWVLEIANKARKQLIRFPQSETIRLVRVTRKMCVNPYGGDVEKIEGEKNVWRRRVGSYRLFFVINRRARLVRVYHIERRTSKTY